MIFGAATTKCCLCTISLGDTSKPGVRMRRLGVTSNCECGARGETKDNLACLFYLKVMYRQLLLRYDSLDLFWVQ